MDETNLRNEELRISRIIEMYKKGKTLKEISVTYNSSYPEIISLVKGVDMDANKPSFSRRPCKHLSAANQIKAIEMYQNKVSIPEISLSFGVNPKSVRDLIKEYNKQIKGSSETDQIAPKKYYHMPEETKQKIVNLYKGGRKIENLALEYGVTDKYILDILTRYRSKHNGFGVSLKKIRRTRNIERKIPKVIDEEKIVEGNDMEDHNVDPLPSQEIDICPPDSKINAEKENILKAIEMHKNGYNMEEIALEVGSAPDDIHRMPLSLKTIHKDDDLLPNNQKCLTGKPKTEDEEIKISTIIEMYKEGKSLKDISAEVQESFQNILSYIKEFDVNLLKPEHIEYMKICPRVLVEELPYENQKMVLEMHRNNVPIIEISETFGISRDFIYRYIREYKEQQEGLQGKEIIAPRHHHFSTETKRKIVEMYKGGYRTVEIANEVGVTSTVINNLIYNFKKKHPDEFLSIKGKEPLKRTAENDVQQQASKKRKINNEDEARKISKIIEMYKEGKSLQDISVEFQESYQQILSYIKEHDENLLKTEHAQFMTIMPRSLFNRVYEESKLKAIEMYKNDVPLTEISLACGIAVGTIHKYILNEKLKTNALESDMIMPRTKFTTDQTKQEIIEMYKNNVPLKKISRSFGLSEHTINKYIQTAIKQEELSKRKVCYPEETKQQIIEMRENGRDIGELALEFGLSRKTIYNMIYDYNKRNKKNDLTTKIKTSFKRLNKTINEDEEDDEEKDEGEAGNDNKHEDESKISEEMIQKIIEMHKSGRTLDKLAHEYGLKTQRVYEIIYEYNKKCKKDIDKKRKLSKIIKKS